MIEHPKPVMCNDGTFGHDMEIKEDRHVCTICGFTAIITDSLDDVGYV